MKRSDAAALSARFAPAPDWAQASQARGVAADKRLEPAERSVDLASELLRRTAAPVALLPAPSRRVGALVLAGRQGGEAVGKARAAELVETIRSNGLFWPLPRAGAFAPETLLVDAGRRDGESEEEARNWAQARLAVARPGSTAVLALQRGALSDLARHHGVPVLGEAAAVDPMGLTRVVGHRLDTPALWAALGGVGVQHRGAEPGLRAAGGDADQAWCERLLDLAWCRDPWDGQPVSLEKALEILAFLRERYAANARPTMTFGMSRWKFSVVRPFLAGPDGATPSRNCRTLHEAVERARVSGGRVAAWGNREIDRAEKACAKAGVPLLRIEDGFVRSVGLGVQRSPPASLVIDQGISYFDSSHVSVLENLLQTAEFSPALVERAATLRQQILEARLTKYNVPGSDLLPAVEGRRRVLVPGQVEGDQSLAYGSPHIRTNAALLEAARARNPDAFILFKPHPDVVTGLRPGDIPAADLDRLADAVVLHAGMAECLDWADAVETMTSLTGFEALLRGKQVTTHGLPFYAGWGLTTDMLALDRRTRRLTLDELVAATLILNPRYIDPVTNLPAEPELVVRRLDEAVHRRPTLAGRALFAYRAGMSLFSHKVYARFERHR